MSEHTCRSCGAPVLAAQSQRDALPMLLDPEPSPDGYVTLSEHHGRVYGTVVRPQTAEALRGMGRELYRHHLTACQERRTA